MKDIFTYELKKISRNRATIILCILLIVFNVLMGCFSSQTELITQERFDKAIDNIFGNDKEETEDSSSDEEIEILI